ncbi:unnamed protein product [Thelazia callipaeda]|uniref:Phage protein n=1 Tax=Thelazia callipaeda TaxID=103827 RepID=A0A0N5CXM7_THECL|nr:unnamed protein product [Thelazia callipaeda]
MSVLVEEKIENEAKISTNKNELIKNHELMEWHAISGVLAVTTFTDKVGSAINFFTPQARKSEYEPIHKPYVRITHICWHPVIEIIAAGYDTGEVLLRFVQTKKGNIEIERV